MGVLSSRGAVSFKKMLKEKKASELPGPCCIELCTISERAVYSVLSLARAAKRALQSGRDRIADRSPNQRSRSDCLWRERVRLQDKRLGTKKKEKGREKQERENEAVAVRTGEQKLSI